MKDELLQQIEALIDDPAPLLNLPASDRKEWENRLYDLAEILECQNAMLAGNDSMAKSIAAQIEGGVDAPW